jgi:hypothetical protein
MKKGISKTTTPGYHSAKSATSQLVYLDCHFILNNLSVRYLPLVLLVFRRKAREDTNIA